MTVESNKALVLDFLKKLDGGKIEDALAILSDDATWWVAGKPELFPLAGTLKKEELRQLLNNLIPPMPDGLRMTPSGITAEGDRVAIEVESYGRASNGRLYNNLYHFLFVISDGRICAVKEYLDTMHTKAVFLD